MKMSAVIKIVETQKNVRNGELLIYFIFKIDKILYIRVILMSVFFLLQVDYKKFSWGFFTRTCRRTYRFPGETL